MSTITSVNPLIKKMLTDITYDLNSIETFEQALENVPAGSRVGITLNPENGIVPTIDRTVQAAEAGYHAVPHLGARFIEDEAELDRILSRLTTVETSEIFVIGGDRESPVGEFDSARELLLAIDSLGYDFNEVGIGGYPSGHESIPDEAMAAALEKKAKHATYIVTQLSFSSDDIVGWIENVRNRGISIPIEVGIPGVMNYWRLMSLCRMWGVAKPLEFLKKTTGITGFAVEMLRSRGTYDPSELIRELAPYFDADPYDVRRLRLYTFNQTADAERWRQAQLENIE
ncbi:MAG: methylenetetrahydrofolate reductase [Halorubrum sp.]